MTEVLRAEGTLQYVDTRNRVWLVFKRSEGDYTALTIKVSPAIGVKGTSLDDLLHQIDEQTKATHTNGKR